MACLSAWVGEVGVACVFEQDLIAPCLATDNPNLRTEVSVYMHAEYVYFLVYRYILAHIYL